MDLLDNITSLITKNEQERPRMPKTKKPEELRASDTGNAKAVTSNNPSTAVAGTCSAQNKVATSQSSDYGGRCLTKDLDRGDFVIPRKLQVEMNGVHIDLSRAPEHVTRYHIDITKVAHEKVKDATRGPKGDFAVQQRRRALFALFMQLVKERPERFGEDSTKHVYDLGNTFYSVGCNITEQDDKVGFTMTPEEIKCPFTRKMFLKRCEKLVFIVQYSGQVLLKESKSSNDPADLREVNRFFEVLTSQSLYHSFLGEVRENATAVLQVDPKKSPFYCGKPVLDFISELANGRNPEDALRERTFQKKIARELRELVVTTTHKDNNKLLYISELSEDSAKNTFFKMVEGEISVEQYFLLKYKFALRYPHLPLAVERKGSSGFNFYPLELLSIELGQGVGSRNLEGRLTEKMTQHSRMLPQEVRDHNMPRLYQANFTSSENRYLASFGVRILPDLLSTEAKVLTVPEIKYKAGSLQPDKSGKLTWDLNQRTQYYRPATIDAFSIVVFDSAIQTSQAVDFSHALIRASCFRGIVIRNTDVKVDHLLSELESEIEKYFKSMVGKVSMVIFVTKTRKDPVHDFLKLLEAKYKVVTQHLCAATVSACCQNRLTKVFENVLLKFNVKNGGVNHIVSPAAAALRSRTSLQDMNGRLFNGKMFIGFDLSHAAAQSLYERQNKIPVKEPTVVGFAYTKGLPTDYAGCWWYQQARGHKLDYIKDYFHFAFTSYHQNNKRLPAEIVVYRCGLGEGEFSQVEDEAKDIRAVAGNMKELNGGKPYNPRLTVIVAQNKSNYSMKAAELNVPPGTCANTDVVNPCYREFFMTSQHANIGTSRPVRYIIALEDKPHRPIAETQHMTHFLCYGHQQSPLPTHLPAVLYAAENLAKRGRAAWKTKISDDLDGGSSTSVRKSLNEGESADDFYGRISRELMNSLPNHYFA